MSVSAPCVQCVGWPGGSWLRCRSCNRHYDSSHNSSHGSSTGTTSSHSSRFGSRSGRKSLRRRCCRCGSDGCCRLCCCCSWRCCCCCWCALCECLPGIPGRCCCCGGVPGPCTVGCCCCSHSSGVCKDGRIALCAGGYKARHSHCVTAIVLLLPVAVYIQHSVVYSTVQRSTMVRNGVSTLMVAAYGVAWLNPVC